MRRYWGTIEKSNTYVKNISLFEPMILSFNVSHYKRVYMKQWKLEIKNSNGNIIAAINGTGKIPATIEWNWSKNEAITLKADIYYYTLYWFDVNNNIQHTQTNKFYVQVVNRDLSIEILPEAKQTLEFIESAN